MEKDYKIKVTDVSELNEQYKEAIQEGTYEGEDVNKFYTSDENKIIKLKLTENEVNILKEISKNTGFSSITKQAKFLLLNSIKNEKLFTNIEIDEFIKTRTEINAIGKNIYQLLKILRSGNSVKINENNLNKTMDNIRDKIDILSDQLGAIIEKNNERI